VAEAVGREIGGVEEKGWRRNGGGGRRRAARRRRNGGGGGEEWPSSSCSYAVDIGQLTNVLFFFKELTSVLVVHDFNLRCVMIFLHFIFKLFLVIN
jgi:hypothetical protein